MPRTTRTDSGPSRRGGSPGSRPPPLIKNATFEGNVAIKWFEDGRLNASAACLDGHLATRGDQVAIIWEGDDPNTHKTITYRALHEQVCRLANVLRERGIRRGDRVTIYLPMVIEAAVAMLACARIGAVHAVVFGGFSPDSLANRIQDCGLRPVDHRRRGPSRRPPGGAEGQCGCSAEDLPRPSRTSWWSA